MSEEERSASQHAQRLQAVIASVARQSRSRPLDETIDLLQVSLSRAGLHAPSTPWLDAVAREAVAGRCYVVATDALLLGLDDTPQSEALEQAPAKLTPQVIDRPEPLPPSEPDPPSRGDDRRQDTTSASAGGRPTRTAVRRSDVWLLAGLAGLAMLLAFSRRRSRRPASPSRRSAETGNARKGVGEC